MQCGKCGASIDQGEERELRNQILCEDCYIDALSPVKVCDPWALYNAKSLERNTTEPTPLTPIQSEILGVLKDAGSLEPSVVRLRLETRLTMNELERELAVLRNMEKVRVENGGERILWRTW